MTHERKGFTITWIVENATFWWYYAARKPCELLSPGFTVNSMRGARWKLKLFPKTLNLRSNVAFSLLRETEDVGQNEMLLDLELCFLDSEGSCLKSEELTKIAFSRDTSSPPLMVERYRAFEQQKDLFLSQDTITVRCRIWNIQVLESESEECIARTRLEVQRGSFDMTLENFSALVLHEKRSLRIREKSDQSPPFSMEILLDYEGSINIAINVVDETFTTPCIFRLFLLSSAAKREKCGNDVIRWTCESGNDLPLHLTKKELMQKKNLYLLNDILTLELEIFFPTGVQSEEINKLECELDSSQDISVTTPVSNNLSIPHLEEELCELPSTLKNDLMSLYNDRVFCDTKLQTEAETFTAHKDILCARSPVFKAMFTTDMKEKASDCVDIKDLSSDTVRRMLLFLYTDTVEDLEWESALELYIAADKYGVITLGQRCKSYLEKNFCISNVCEILIMANMHQNSDLIKAVQYYILEHDVGVFRSNEWKSFVRNHGQLAAETMCLKYR